jgi:hypothetical protein
MIMMDQTAATVANLIRYRLPEYPKVLDIGCAGGTLAGELPPSVHYLRRHRASGTSTTELLN